MLNFIKNFKNDESGAVTVDWVVLTAAIVLLGGVVGAAVSGGAEDMANNVGDYLADQEIGVAAAPAAEPDA